MKKKGLKAISAIVTCLGVVLIGTMLSASSCLADKPVVQKQDKETLRYICPPDSAVVNRLSDTICAVLFSAKKATLYKVNPAVQVRDNDMTIGGAPVEKCLGKMNAKDLYAMQVLLSDKNTYSDSPVVPLTPYAPTFAVELSGPNGTVCLMFSLLSQEVGIVYDGLLVATHSYKNRGLMAKFFRQHMSKEYLNYLISL